MAFKLNNPPYKDDKVKVYKVPMEDGVLGKANNKASSNEGFSIHINQDVNSTDKLNEVVNHENGHIDQMNRGDLAYDDDKVVWKGKEHLRSDMEEGNHDLEWEKEIYEQENQSPMAFKLRQGKGNETPFSNLTGRGLIKPTPLENKVDYNHDGDITNDGDNVGETDPPESNKQPKTVSEMPYSGSKEAERQKAAIAKAHPNSTEREVEMKPGDVGYKDDGYHKEVGVKKYTSYWKAPTEELKKKGNEYWASLSEEEKQAIRDKKSRYTTEPMPIERIEPKPIDTNMTPRKIETPPPPPPPPPIETPDPETRDRIKTKREIKREAFAQYGGAYQPYRFGIGYDGPVRKKSKILTKLLGGKTVMSESAQAHYDSELAKRKELKRGNPNVTWLNRDERMADQDTNLHSNQKVTRTETKYDQDGNVID